MNTLAALKQSDEFLSDAHCHLAAQTENNHSIGQGPVILCTGHPDDWPLVIQHASPHCLPAFGIHPWQIQASTLSSAKKSIARLQEYWPPIIAQGLPCILGEIGLDKAKTYQKTLPLQLEILHALLDAPCPSWRILNLHVVHAWPEVFAPPLREKIFAPHQKVILHGFKASREIMHRLQAYPHVYFSFALKHLTEKMSLLLPDIDPARILIESDADRPLAADEMRELLRKTHNHIAHLCQLEPAAFAQQLKHNWQELMREI